MVRSPRPLPTPNSILLGADAKRCRSSLQSLVPDHLESSLQLRAKVEQRQEPINRISHDRRENGPGHQLPQHVVGRVRRYVAEAYVEPLSRLSTRLQLSLREPALSGRMNEVRVSLVANLTQHNAPPSSRSFQARRSGEICAIESPVVHSIFGEHGQVGRPVVVCGG